MVIASFRLYLMTCPEESLVKKYTLMEKLNHYCWWVIVGFLCVFTEGYSQGTLPYYQSPQPAARFINPEQNILFKLDIPLDVSTVTENSFLLYGSKSNQIDFQIFIRDDGKTVCIQPQTSFQWGEKIQVSMQSGLKTVQGDVLLIKPFGFYIKDRETLSLLRDYKQMEEAKQSQIKNTTGQFSGIYPTPKVNNLPADYPAPTAQFGPNHTSDDAYIFMNMVCRSHDVYSNYLTIIDDYGVPVYYQKVDLSSRDFKVLSNGYLTYSNNDLSNPENEKYYLMDSSYVIIDSVRMGNGYNVDGHDMLLLENGHYLMISYDLQLVDMSVVVPGGNPNATVIGLVLQEVDLDRNVYFQWRSWDHFQITDATYDIDLTNNIIDYVHANALELDTDGHILLSCRHMDEVTKININTGQIIWRFGLNSENNMFTILQDEMGFSHQHDIRRLENNLYTVYDNGNNHTPQASRALKYHIDEQTMVAYLDWEYQRDGLYAPATGSFRISEEGKKLICWGTHFPLNITELNADNSLSMNISLPEDVASYRAVKYPWRTNLFSAFRNLSLGNFAGYNAPKENYLRIYNHSTTDISITSTYNHLTEYMVVSELPLTIPPGESGYVTVLFSPTSSGEFHDVLTLNSDNADNTQRISRQVNLLGINIDTIPSVFITPEQGSEGVDPATSIQIAFDVPVRMADSAEITDDLIPSLIYFNTESYVGDNVSFTGHIDDARMMITLYPDQLLLEQQQYYINLKGGVLADFEGHIIRNAEICYFTTGLIIDMEETDYDFIALSPNPFNESIQLKFNEKGSWKIQLFALDGTRQLHTTTEQSMLNLDTRILKPGLYLLEISNLVTGKTKTYKVAKQ